MEQLKDFISTVNGEKWLTEDDRNQLKISYRIKEMIYEKQSPYQHIMVVDTYDFGKMLVLDGVVQTTARDGYIYNEMITHVPLHLHPSPNRVLIIGGGDLGAAREVAKYKAVQQVDVVEIDECVVEASKQYVPEVSGHLLDDRIHFHFQDGITFIKEKKQYYDVIMIDSSDPVGPAEKLFEADFYKNVFDALKGDGLMVCQSESPIFYKEIVKRTFTTIQSLFPVTKMYTAVVPTYPGGLWSFTIGSKKYDHFIQPEYEKDTRYFNGQILHSCFELPEFMKQLLERNK